MAQDDVVISFDTDFDAWGGEVCLAACFFSFRVGCCYDPLRIIMDPLWRLRTCCNKDV